MNFGLPPASPPPSPPPSPPGPRSRSIRPPTRLLLLTGVAAVIGVVGGLAAWFLLHLIGLITNLALFGRWGWTAPSSTELVAGPRVVVSALVGALIVSLIARWAPVIRGHGIPEAMEVILTRQSRIAPRTAVAKPVSAAVAIGSGAPFGAEGPIIVTGGALGSLAGQLIEVSAAERKILLAAGAAAGMAATFGAPLASVVLAIELLLFEFSTRAFIPLVVASSIAAGMHAALLGGSGPLFHVPAHDYAGLSLLPIFAVLGLGAGLLATVINKGLFTIEGWYRRLPIPELWHPVVGALVFATIGLFVPRVLGVGYDVIDDLLADRLAVGTVAVLAGAKLLAWWFALASGTSGGTLAPMLLISAGYGSLFGSAVDQLLPGLGVSPGAFAVVAMAATFGASTQATFTSMVFVFELTRDYEVILPLMGTCVLADLVARAFMDQSIMTEKLHRRGLRVHTDFEVDPYRVVQVGQVMTTEVETLAATTTLADALTRFGTGRHTGYPVVDAGGACVGIVTRTDLLLADPVGTEPLIESSLRPVVTVGPEVSALAALELMIDEDVERLPVVDPDGRLVGIVTRTDLLRVRAVALGQERHEPGWLRRPLRPFRPET